MAETTHVLGPSTPKLSFWRVRCWLRAEEPLALPGFPGSLIRGALGKALREISCSTGGSTCVGCAESGVCAYGHAFETPVSLAGSPGPFAPHPFVLGLDLPASGRLSGHQSFPMDLTLIGRGKDHLASFVEAVRLMGHRGLSTDRRRVVLERVEDVAPGAVRTILGHGDGSFTASPTDWTVSDLAPRSTTRLTLATVSPVRLLARRDRVTDLDLPLLLRALFRRIGALARFHCGFEPEVDYGTLLALAASVRIVEAKLEWTDLRRYSGRQKRRMALGGLTGSLVFEGDLERFLPFLELGEIVHVGKGTAFGLGRYRLEHALPPDHRPLPGTGETGS
ncbi:MAG: CRISPR system precrRNA processing endoribonuclease RAMP protein Cas6 [Candidatus Riflebacteria bacterium]|nr:CRISPR system precrRNA processing endoribonuclease RAMP protein Cas6 [Candidatus Riflebacteria bacterium]